MKTISKTTIVLTYVFLGFWLGGCANDPSSSAQTRSRPSDRWAVSPTSTSSPERAPSGKPSAQNKKKAGFSTPSKGILTQPVKKIAGPKRTIAVGKFDTIGAFTQKYGDWDIGGGLSAMLTTALVESNQFIVLERANVSQILSEQEMKGSGVTKAGTGPALGKLAGVQYLIYGAVTEFGVEEEGGGTSLGFSGGGIGNLFGGALSHQSSEGSVTMDLRLVDTTTGEVLKTLKVTEPISSSGFDVSFGYQGINLGTNKFWKTPLGEATRRAINNAVHQIAFEARNQPWVGRVVDVTGEEVYINAGSKSGIEIGDQFMIERVEKTFTDPETGEVLGLRKKKLGLVKMEGVEEKLSYGNFSPLGIDAPKRGDRVLTAAP